MLTVFWKSHDPTRNSWSRQYRNALFYHNELQRTVAVETRDRLTSETKGKIATAIEPYSSFSIAEDYHQKHSLRSFPAIMTEFRALFPDMKSLINSTAVTRVNAYLGGYGSCAPLKEEIESFGLSRSAKETLTSVVCGRKTSLSCPLP